MNYNQKKTLIGRILYIGLTLMAVTVLVVTLYTFFGSSRRQNNNDIPLESETTDRSIQNDPVHKQPVETQTPTTTNPPVIEPEDTRVTPTDVVPEKDWSTVTLTLPVKGTVSKGHDLKHAVFSLTMNDYRVHQGIDIACHIGDDVLACTDGVVKTVGKDPFMGTTVIIDHGDGLVSCYRNLAEDLAENIREGAAVNSGQIIGAVGESAIIEISDEPHLHFELTLNDNPIDPMTMLPYQTNEAGDEIAEEDR